MDTKELLEQAWNLWTSHRRPDIVPLVERDGTVRTIVENYLLLQGGFFWNKQDLDAVLAVSKWGLAYARKNGAHEGENVLLYNVSTFTLPWWHDSLYATAGQRRIGREAAELLVDLRRRLDKGPGPMSMALWVAGAHALFDGDAQPALDSFNASMLAAREAADPGLEACALEGLGRTRALLQPEDREWGKETLVEAKAMYARAGEKFSFNIREVERFEARAGLRYAVNPF